MDLLSKKLFLCDRSVTDRESECAEIKVPSRCVDRFPRFKRGDIKPGGMVAKFIFV